LLFYYNHLRFIWPIKKYYLFSPLEVLFPQNGTHGSESCSWPLIVVAAVLRSRRIRIRHRIHRPPLWGPFHGVAETKLCWEILRLFCFFFLTQSSLQIASLFLQRLKFYYFQYSILKKQLTKLFKKVKKIKHTPSNNFFFQQKIEIQLLYWLFKGK